MYWDCSIISKVVPSRGPPAVLSHFILDLGNHARGLPVLVGDVERARGARVLLAIFPLVKCLEFIREHRYFCHG